MQKNVLQLHRKLRNVVDLHDARPILGKGNRVVDLRRRPFNEGREPFESVLTRSLYTHRKIEVPAKKKVNHFSAISKTVAVLLLVSLNSFALSQVGNTFSIFNDVESSKDNTYTAGIIDFTLALSPFSNDAWSNLVPGTTTAQDIDVEPHQFSNPFFYFASSTNLTGDSAFCNSINVLATLNGDTMYNGPLSDLLTATTTLIAQWNLEFSNNQNFFNSVCQFDIDFNGWQTRHDYPKYHDGYSDTEKTTHILYSDGLKINKVYFEKESEGSCICGDPHHEEYGDDDEYHCDGDNGSITIINDNEATTTNNVTVTSSTGGNSGGNITTSSSTSNVVVTNTVNQNTIIIGGKKDYEWVELYNPNNEPANIDGWYICDGQSCDILNADSPIPAFGFAVIAGDEKAWKNWNVPEDFVKIIIDDGKIGDGLDNENDALFLKRPDYFTFDQVNWGIPSNLWPYYVPELWNPGVASTTEGTMIARIPTGFDTNQVSDWQTLLRPEVDLLYPGNHVNHPWYWGFTYLVTWDSVNPNGPLSDLLVDIILIQDSNYNKKVDKNDERLVLKSKIFNDGNEEITVPEGFIGYIWIEIVVTGPENPMANDKDRSGKIYDPVPQFMLNDEDEKEAVAEAVMKQMEMTGESEYEFMLIEPVIEIEVSTSTATTTDEVVEATSTSTEEIVEELATSTPPVVEEETSTSTDSTFEEEINILIEESRTREREERERVRSTTTPAVLEEETEIEE